MAERTSFCGYVINRVRIDDRANASQRKLLKQTANGRPLVVASTGGGEDGFKLLETFVKASVGARWRGVAVSGPLAKRKDHHLLRELSASTGVTAFGFVAGLGQVIAVADALVCMGGYNTLVEAVSSGTPTVCVPRVEPRTEQLIRAQALERLKLVRFIKPSHLEPQVLRAEIERALAVPRAELRARGSILSFNGAAEAARHLVALAGGESMGVDKELAARA
ncbi:MAG: hypothetical protein H0W66_12265 [Chthoniobacterales bacterium]|nr:hypothetical protein [Chthoniobacterales bacterium]